ncbi:MAG TPA: ribosome biogenesis GTP-binding protein YihA/YsxC [Xanthomonadaceae bacterium]|nr:ribosome biogenesis GTP-binding protein YihA/YsxC [Xanthomonadaceae bacterium]
MPTDPLAATEYLKSVHHLRDLPPDCGREVAIAGRSNAGKSSAINAICRRRSLARTSRTPGRTQQLVYFRVAEDRYLVDLPGYGYAKVPEALRAHWRVLIDRYLQSRQALAGLVLVMDARHPLREFDRHMLEYAQARALPCLVLLTKADKLGHGQQQQVLRQVRAELGEAAVVLPFSAVSSLGVEAARTQLWQLLEGTAAP